MYQVTIGKIRKIIFPIVLKNKAKSRTRISLKGRTYTTWLTSGNLATTLNAVLCIFQDMIA